MTLDYATLPDPEAAQAITAYVREWDSVEPLRYANLGLMVLAVERRLLWRHIIDPADGMPCRSLARWIRVAAPKAYSTCYQALRDVEELRDVPAADLAQIPQSNISVMRQLSGGVRKQPEVLEAAKTVRQEQLVDYIREHYPQQHLETKRVMKFTPDESAAERIEEALAEAETHGARSRNDALELLAVTAMEVWRMEAAIEEAHENTERA